MVLAVVLVSAGGAGAVETITTAPPGWGPPLPVSREIDNGICYPLAAKICKVEREALTVEMFEPAGDKQFGGWARNCPPPCVKPEPEAACGEVTVPAYEYSHEYGANVGCDYVSFGLTLVEQVGSTTWPVPEMDRKAHKGTWKRCWSQVWFDKYMKLRNAQRMVAVPTAGQYCEWAYDGAQYQFVDHYTKKRVVYDKEAVPCPVQ